MFSRRSLIASLMLTVAASTSLFAGDYHSPRQYYSSWEKHPSRTYHFRRLYYKPRPGYSGYRHHYVMYFKSRPGHLYFYNPYSKRYWGRCAVNHQGGYSMLPPQYRMEKLSTIPESAFPEPVDPPAIPETVDGLPLDLPPDDLPLD